MTAGPVLVPAPGEHRPRLRLAEPPPAGPVPEDGITWVRLVRRAAAPAEHSLVAVGPPGWLVDVRYRAGDGAAVRIDVAGPGSGPHPCFVLATAPLAPVPTVTLHAVLPGPGRAPGAVLLPRAVPAAARMGAVQWQPRSGLVEVVRVEPAWRRRGYGRLLVTAAEAVRALHGWPPLVSDGRLTDLGAAWLATAPGHWRPRLSPRTAHLPPEPAPGRPTGVARLVADLPARLV